MRSILHFSIQVAPLHFELISIFPAPNSFSNPNPTPIPRLHSIHHLSFPRNLLLALPHLLLALLGQVLGLLLGAHALELLVAQLLLGLVAGDLALLGLLFLVGAADLRDLLLARLLDAAQGLGAKVRVLGQEVGQTQEVGEQGQRRRVVGGELDAIVDALAGGCVVEPGWC